MWKDFGGILNFSRKKELFCVRKLGGRRGRMKLLSLSLLFASTVAWKEIHSDVGVLVKLDTANSEDKNAFVQHLQQKYNIPKSSIAENIAKAIEAAKRRRLNVGTAINDGDGLTTDQKQSLLDDHNDYRSTVANGDTPGQPAASNMNELFWDDALAAVAQNYAEQCIWAHNTDPAGDFVDTTASISATFGFDADEIAVGENLYAWSSSEPLVDGSISVETFMRSGVTAWYVRFAMPTQMLCPSLPTTCWNMQV